VSASATVRITGATVLALGAISVVLGIAVLADGGLKHHVPLALCLRAGAALVAINAHCSADPHQ
jgi:hypothetical protein